MILIEYFVPFNSCDNLLIGQVFSECFPWTQKRQTADRWSFFPCGTYWITEWVLNKTMLKVDVFETYKKNVASLPSLLAKMKCKNWQLGTLEGKLALSKSAVVLSHPAACTASQESVRACTPHPAVSTFLSAAPTQPQWDCLSWTSWHTLRVRALKLTKN